MATEETPDEKTPAAPEPSRAPRSTPELITELRVCATGFTLAAIAVVKNDLTQFVFSTDDDPLARLNDLVQAGGHPIGIVGARIGNGSIEYHPQPFVEFQRNPRALAYLQSLRTPFLGLIWTHIDRMPDTPGNN